jgi:hypothetical protein
VDQAVDYSRILWLHGHQMGPERVQELIRVVGATRVYSIAGVYTFFRVTNKQLMLNVDDVARSLDSSSLQRSHKTLLL